MNEMPNSHFSGDKKSFGQKMLDFWIPNKNDTQKRRIGKIVSLAAAVILIVCIICIIGILVKYMKPRQTANTYSDMLPSSSAGVSSPDATASTPTAPAVLPPAELDPETGVNVDLLEFYKENPETVGFISIPGTKLAYPVPQGKDNAYYLDHTLFKEKNPFGVPFADFRATIAPNMQSDNVTIYGHAAKDGTFFAPVKQYKDIDFYREHPIIEFNTIYSNAKYKVVGFFMEYVNLDNDKMFAYHDFIDKSSDQAVMSHIDNVKKRSYFNTTVDVLPTDQFITLSTCDTEVSYNDYRLALIARRVRPGEDEAVDVAGATENKEMIMPEGWMKKKGRKNPYVK